MVRARRSAGPPASPSTEERTAATSARDFRLVRARALKQALGGDELSGRRVGSLPGDLDARDPIRLLKEHADLCPLEERHRILRMRRRNSIQRRLRVGEAPGVQIENAQLQIVLERDALQSTR